jgi:Gpi18-like mannosyltransferase
VRFRDGAAFSVATFVGVRVLLSLVAVIAVRYPEPPPTVRPDLGAVGTPGWHNAFDGTDRWDAKWFERIAREGYGWNEASAAFFPGYPLIINFVVEVSPFDETRSALLISNAAFLAALIVLFALTAREFSLAVARRTVLLLALFPTSFFFLAPYSESIFLLSTLLTFWWARRGDWPKAACAGFIAAATRSVGILLVPSLLIEARHPPAGERRNAVIWSTVPLAAPVLYGLYWLVRADDALRPFHAQSSWLRVMTFPVVTLGNALALAVAGSTSAHGLYWTADFVLTALLLLPLTMRWRLVPPTYLVFVLAVVLVVLSYPPSYRPLVSAPRYLMVLFPLFWPMAVWLHGRWFRFAVAASAAGFVFMAATFMNWGLIT